MCSAEEPYWFTKLTIGLVQTTTFLVRCLWWIKEGFETLLQKQFPECMKLILSFTKVEITTEDNCLLAIKILYQSQKIMDKLLGICICRPVEVYNRQVFT